VAFGCIWISLAIYTAEAVALNRAPVHQVQARGD